MIWISAILVLGNLFSTLGWLILLSDVTQNKISLEDRFLSISSVITISAFAFPFIWPNDLMYLFLAEAIYILSGFFILIVMGINYRNNNP